MREEIISAKKSEYYLNQFDIDKRLNTEAQRHRVMYAPCLSVSVFNQSYKL